MWSHENIQRLIFDFSEKVAGNPFTGSAELYQKQQGDWRDDIGLDSIQLMELAAYVNSFFCLFEVKDPPYLLTFKRVEEWVEQVLIARKKMDARICFQTSGTTGAGKIIPHSMEFLRREIDFLSTRFEKITEIIPMVPSYTVYGFLFTVGLPAQLQAAVHYPSAIDWQKTTISSLIVATPFNWQWLLSSLAENNLSSSGISSGAPLYPELFNKIQNKGISLTEIYGSTETGGVAYRQQYKDPFQLFPYWQLVADGEGAAIADQESKQVHLLMDTIQQIGAQTFTITGRKDKQVKIAGVLVDIEQVTATIQQLPNVKDCTISAKAVNNEVMLQASITLLNDSDNEREMLRQQISQQLPAHEKPRAIYFTSKDG